MDLICFTAEALERARNKGHSGILIAQINSESLTPTPLTIGFIDRLSISLLGKVLEVLPFLSTEDVLRRVGVQVELSQASEWFPLDFIPAKIISGTMIFNCWQGSAWQRTGPVSFGGSRFRHWLHTSEKKHAQVPVLRQKEALPVLFAPDLGQRGSEQCVEVHTHKHTFY
jgi:hypothetical protein